MRAVTVDIEKLRPLLALLKEEEIFEFEHEDEGEKIRIVRGRVMEAAPVAYAAHAAPSHAHAAASGAAGGAPSLAPAEDADAVDVTSPFVGTFYRAASPDTPSFVETGAVVRTGQTLCIVEAMKLMNEIEAEVSGIVTEIYVQNGKSVEFGQKLFRIKKT